MKTKSRHSRKSFGWPFLFTGVQCPVSNYTSYRDGPRCIYDHYRNERSENYSCHKCGNVFTRKNNLYNHLKFQCGQLPRFNCPYCPYRTRHSSNVRSHIRRMHPDQVVYVLDIRGDQQNNEASNKWIFERSTRRCLTSCRQIDFDDPVEFFLLLLSYSPSFFFFFLSVSLPCENGRDAVPYKINRTALTLPVL